MQTKYPNQLPPTAILHRHFLKRFLYMLGPHSILSNLIASMLYGLCAFLQEIAWLLPEVSKQYHHQLQVIIGIIASIQMLRSAQKSLLLLFFCFLIGTSMSIVNYFG